MMCPLLQAAYLALTQLLDHNNELVLLLVNTLLSDLKSDNYITGGHVERSWTLGDGVRAARVHG